MFNSKNSKGFVFLVMVVALVACLAGYVQAKPITLIYSTYTPPSYKIQHENDQSFVDYVNEHGEGKVKIEYYHSGTLLSGNEELAGVEAGTADIVYYPYGTPVVDYYYLPFLFADWETFNKAGKPGNEIYETISKILEQKYGYKMLGGVCAFPYYLYVKGKQITKLEDLKGLVIRATSKETGQWIKAIGASPEFMPSSELYLALQRGVLDGTLHCPSSFVGRACQEVCKYGVNSPIIYYTPVFLLMMADRYNNLPEDVQKILLEAGTRWVENINTRVYQDDEAIYIPKMKEAGMVFNEWSPEVVEECKKIAEPLWEEWAKQYGNEGSRLIELAQEVQ
jgi:TRAP-type C4-dicarboxylate transport system substrate-binding protein